MNSTLKKKFSLIALLLFCMTIVSCSHSKVNNTSENTPESIENSLIPSQIPKESKDSNNSKEEKIYGKWKILKMVGEGYIYGEFSMDDYVGGIVSIHENFIETDLPLGRWKLDNPIYKLEKQNGDDFWEYSHANIHNGFGFKSEQIELVKVFDNNDEWDEFGGIFWIRDKTHLIFFGPVYFLAEKIQ